MGILAVVPGARQPRGCQHRAIRVQKALGEMFATPSFFGADATYPNYLDTSSMENRTVVYATNMYTKNKTNLSWSLFAQTR